MDKRCDTQRVLDILFGHCPLDPRSMGTRVSENVEMSLSLYGIDGQYRLLLGK
jgi:hypothetical protein